MTRLALRLPVGYHCHEEDGNDMDSAIDAMTKPEDTTSGAVGSPLDVEVRPHTPGPWRAKPHGVVVGGAEIALPRGSVQQQVAMVCTIDDGDRDANARLIEAAPDLLDVVQALVFLVHGRSTDPAMILAEDSPLMDAARDALRKVTGAAERRS